MRKSFLRIGLGALLLLGYIVSFAEAGTFEVAFSDRSSRQTLVTLSERGVEFVQLEHLAAVFEIDLEVDPLDDRVTLRKQDKTASFFPGQQSVIADRRSYFLETPPLKIEEKIMVPLEFLTTILPLVYDHELQWDAGQRTLFVGVQNLEVLGISFSPYGDYTRIVIETNKAPSYTVSEKLPSMLIFNFPHAEIHVQNEQVDINSRSVKHVKVINTFGTTQIIVRLGDDFNRYTHRLLEDPPRLLLDVYNTQESIVEAPHNGDDILEQDIGAVNNQPSAEAPPAFSLQTVVIDPGHGGSDQGILVAPGTEGTPDLLEKQLTLHIAKLLGTALTQRLVGCEACLRVKGTNLSPRKVGPRLPTAAGRISFSAFMSITASSLRNRVSKLM